jgi:hypothetical protein
MCFFYIAASNLHQHVSIRTSKEHINHNMWGSKGCKYDDWSDKGDVEDHD